MTIGSLYIPTIREWQAFFSGMRNSRTARVYGCNDLQLAYDCGQEARAALRNLIGY